MRKVAPPCHTASNTFSVCIETIRDSGKRKRLLRARHKIEQASNEYERAASKQSLHKVADDHLVDCKVRVGEMQWLYEQRMARMGSPGRPIYDEILSGAPNGFCPYCTVGESFEIDHFLPKSKYPALAVTPLNLVPICGVCNDQKHDKAPESASDVPFHPYYDEIDDTEWLSAELIEVKPPALRFSVSPPRTWDSTLTKRVELSFQIFCLGTRYARWAANELSSIQNTLMKLHQKGGNVALREHLDERAEKPKCGYRSQWELAMYRALAESDWFCDRGFALIA